jgi:hypothetical protein
VYTLVIAFKNFSSRHSSGLGQNQTQQGSDDVQTPHQTKWQYRMNSVEFQDKGCCRRTKQDETDINAMPVFLNEKLIKLIYTEYVFFGKFANVML